LPNQKQSLAKATLKLLGIASCFVYLCNAFILHRNICLTQACYWSMPKKKFKMVSNYTIYIILKPYRLGLFYCNFF